VVESVGRTLGPTDWPADHRDTLARPGRKSAPGDLCDAPVRIGSTGYWVDDNVTGQGVRLIIGIATRGCRWARSTHGGCYHCGVVKLLQANTFDEQTVVRDFSRMMEGIPRRHFESVCIYVPGSFFDEDDLSRDPRVLIINALMREIDFDTLVVESLPQYVSTRHLIEIKEALDTKRLMVGLGLGLADDVLRRRTLNSPVTLRGYREALANLQQTRVGAITYVTLKPPYLNEAEAVNEAINTAKLAFSWGTTVVTIEPIAVQPQTVCQRLYDLGTYGPPWLWSVRAVLAAVTPLGPANVGMFYYPQPTAYPHNCCKCTASVLAALRDYNATGNISKLMNLDCDCLDRWSHELALHGGLDGTYGNTGDVDAVR